MRVHRIALVLAVAAGVAPATSCNTPPPAMKDAAAPDLVPPPRPDLAMPDLDIPPDLSMPDIAKIPGPCAGTAAAGTCVDDFFARVAMCFPMSGDCTYSSMAYMVYSTCWASGSKRLEMGMLGQIQGSWKNGASTCMVGNQVNTGWVYFANNQMISLDFNARFTCPNGVTVQVMRGVCPALDTLLGLYGTPKDCMFVGGGPC